MGEFLGRWTKRLLSAQIVVFFMDEEIKHQTWSAPVSHCLQHDNMIIDSNGLHSITVSNIWFEHITCAPVYSGYLKTILLASMNIGN